MFKEINILKMVKHFININNNIIYIYMCDTECQNCKQLKFCKKKYSSLYYKNNKEDILEYQKTKYNKIKIKKHKITIERGCFDPFKNDR